MPGDKRNVLVDLHGHDVRTAVRLAVTRVADAYHNGFETIELVHGAADVTEPVEDGRGRIKWELRSMVKGGQFNSYVVPDKTWEKDASIVFTLRANPRARRNAWSSEPPRSHGGRGHRF